MDTSQKAELVYRGQAVSEWPLQPCLDRSILQTESFEEKMRKEKEYIDAFRRESHKFLGNLEKEYLKNPDDWVISMTVMQHFGAPTRLLDWTRSGAIAAYFACINESQVDGNIWWMNETDVAAWLDSRWDSWGYKRRPDRQINLNDRIGDYKAPNFVSMTHLRIPFSRAQAQRGLFTFGSRPGLLHDDQLEAQLSEGSYGRVVIPVNLKSEVIRYLERMGIDAISLQHTGADRVGLKMAWDREHEARIEENKDVEDTTK